MLRFRVNDPRSHILERVDRLRRARRLGLEARATDRTKERGERIDRLNDIAGRRHFLSEKRYFERRHAQFHMLRPRHPPGLQIKAKLRFD
jgi:hypothetical protein